LLKRCVIFIILLIELLPLIYGQAKMALVLSNKSCWVKRRSHDTCDKAIWETIARSRDKRDRFVNNYYLKTTKKSKNLDKKKPYFALSDKRFSDGL